MKHQRKDNRVQIQRAIVFSTQDGKEYRANAFNISRTGIAIQSGKVLALGAGVSLHFNLELHTEKFEFNVNARVIHAYIQGDTYAIGLEFMELDAIQHEWLDEFISFRLELRDG